MSREARIRAELEGDFKTIFITAEDTTDDYVVGPYENCIIVDATALSAADFKLLLPTPDRNPGVPIYIEASTVGGTRSVLVRDHLDGTTVVDLDTAGGEYCVLLPVGRRWVVLVNEDV